MYCQLVIFLRVLSTSGSKDVCGLQYRPTSAKAVTSLVPPPGLFTKKGWIEIFYTYTNVLRLGKDSIAFQLIESRLLFDRTTAAIQG